jgi:hypothetical protein
MATWRWIQGIDVCQVPSYTTPNIHAPSLCCNALVTSELSVAPPQRLRLRASRAAHALCSGTSGVRIAPAIGVRGWVGIRGVRATRVTPGEVWALACPPLATRSRRQHQQPAQLPKSGERRQDCPVDGKPVTSV